MPGRCVVEAGMIAAGQATSQIAIYWDFENIHIALCREENGPRSYKPWERQEALVDVDGIMNYISSVGSVCVNRAYCNWSYLDRYADDLGSHAVQLVQMWPLGNSGKYGADKPGKNGADIQMVVDIMEDLRRHEHLDTFIIVSGDSDFIGVLSRLKQYGKRVIGIGVRGSTHRLVMKVCDEFKYYHLLVKANAAGGSGPEQLAAELDLPGAKRLLADAMGRLADVDAIKQAAIKQMMLRLNSVFDERSLGFASFSAFLNACTEVVEFTPGVDGAQRTVRLRSSRTQDTAPELAKARKLFIAAMTFLTRKNPAVPLGSLKTMLRQLDPDFDEKKLGLRTFLTFVHQFLDVVRIKGDDERRTLHLLCQPDEGGYKLPSAPSAAPPAAAPAAPSARGPLVIPALQILESAHHYHWNTLRAAAVPDWEAYYRGLNEHLLRYNLPADEATQKAVRVILVGSKALRPKTDNVGIMLRQDFTGEQEFWNDVWAFIAREQAKENGTRNPVAD